MRGTEQFQRQQGIIPINKLQEAPFTVIGGGSLGSATVNVLAMMGAENITVFDNDDVEAHNLPVQFFSKDHVTDPPKAKVVALKEFVQYMHGIQITGINERFDGSQHLNGIVISAVDHMDSRKSIWSKIKLNMNIGLYIDTRAAGRVAEIFCLNPTNLTHIKNYEASYLFPQEEGLELPCTEKMTTFISWGVASNVGSMITSFLKSEHLDFRTCIDLANREVLKTDD